MGLLDLIAEDRVVIIYRPRLNRLTGDANSTIFLCQIIYWRQRMGRAFYKSMTKDGATEKEKSFASELGFSKKEVERAAKNLAHRGLIRYWYQRLEHKMWWNLAENLEEKIRECYSSELSSCNHSKLPLVTSGSNKRGLREITKGDLEIITETTSETTTSSSPTPTPPIEEEVKNIPLPLPHPFRDLPPAQLVEAGKLCKLNNLSLQEQCEALKSLVRENPANYLLKVLRNGGFAGAAEVAAKAREAEESNAEVRKIVEDAHRLGDIPRWERVAQMQGGRPCN